LKVKNNNGPTFPKLIILALLVGVLAIGGGVIGSMVSSGKIQEFFNKEEEVVVEKITVPFSEFLLNLKPVSENDNSYLRIEFSFLVTSAEDEEALLAEEAVVRDAVIAILREKTRATIFSEENGSLTVKEEIKAAINDVMGRDVVADIYVVNMVMQ
jgi:flagellar protein FliL